MGFVKYIIPERRQFRGAFETREEAEKRLAELLDEEQEAEAFL